MEYLVSEFQKFYHKVNSKLIFCNGMSLNQLALEMWTELGYEGMDSSLLSRIIHGERLLTRPQLSVFCKILGLNEIEKYSLENALGKDLLYKHIGEVISISQYGELVADEKVGKMILLNIRKLKDKGNVHEAMQMASFFEGVFKFTPKIQNVNNSLFAKILNEKVRCLIYIEKPNTLLPKVTEINTTALKIGYETKDPDIISMAHAHIGGSLYVAQRLKESAFYLEKTLEIVDAKTKVEYVRTLLNNYAFLHDFTSYKRIYRKAEKILSEKEKYNKNHIASMYEAISRSLALMGNISSAKKFLYTINTSSLEKFYQSEMIRGKMFVCYQGFLKKRNFDIDEVRQLFHESRLNKFRPFQRHRGQIIKMYQEMCYG